LLTNKPGWCDRAPFFFPRLLLPLSLVLSSPGRRRWTATCAPRFPVFFRNSCRLSIVPGTGVSEGVRPAIVMLTQPAIDPPHYVTRPSRGTDARAVTRGDPRDPFLWERDVPVTAPGVSKVMSRVTPRSLRRERSVNERHRHRMRGGFVREKFIDSSAR